MRWQEAARRRTLAVGLAAAMTLGGCAVQAPALLASPPAGLPAQAELDATPFFPQTDYHCGPAALATALTASGISAAPEDLSGRIFLPARQGTLQAEMLAGARRAGAVPTVIPGTLDALLREVAAGHTVVVLQNLGLPVAPSWHYAVVVGYDLAGDEIVLRSGVTRREVMSLRTFEHTWRRAGHWAFVALPPGQWPVTATEASVVAAAVGFERTAPPALSRKVYAEALQRFPDSLSLSMGLANVTHASGDRAQAAELFRAAALAHRSAPAWINLSATLLELGRPQAALDAADAALSLDDARWRLRAEAAHEAARLVLQGTPAAAASPGAAAVREQMPERRMREPSPGDQPK